MNILIVGGGGREHAIMWKLQQSERAQQIFVAPGNAGTARNVNPKDIVAFSQEHAIDLVVIGPEAPLVGGLVDDLMRAGIQAFGPTAAAAQLEGSKAFAKKFMLEHGIPTAEYGEFDDVKQAFAFIDSTSYDVVVKADGLAAGKGVIVCDSKEQAKGAVKAILQDKQFGAAGAKVVIEERLIGKEASILAFCDGQHVVMMPPSRDHKRVYDHDEGPNTGGMGAFAPVVDISEDDLNHYKQTIIEPVIQAMAARGTPYKGVLYAGLMLTPQGAKVLEFNCRFGDPETQVILPLLDSDLLEIMLACVAGTLDQVHVQWKKAACATVVMASGGYPGNYSKGVPILGLDTVEGAIVFHAGTSRSQSGDVVTSGGRVLSVSAIGDTLQQALNNAYTNVEKIHFDGAHYRHDIGK
ncbi:MAG: phosphoribosylamine--glycine ligase [Phototrophicales bacterium]